MRKTRIAVTVLAAAVAVPAHAQQTPGAFAGPVSRATFDEWMTRVSNAGRWGKDDELGTLNLITEQTRLRGAATIKTGRSISLAHDLVPGPNARAIKPLTMQFHVEPNDSAITWAVDEAAVIAHGWAYNTAEHLERWERMHGVRVEAGDIVLIRTGRWPREQAQPTWDARAGAAGPHPSVGLWLKTRGVSALGGDLANELYPSVVPGVSEPLHMLTLVAMGMPLFDNLDLEDVAKEAAAQSRWTFLFVAAPPKAQGATGALVNPLAIF